MLTITYRIGSSGRVFRERFTVKEAKFVFLRDWRELPNWQILEVTWKGNRNVAALRDWLDRMEDGTDEIDTDEIDTERAEERAA